MEVKETLGLIGNPITLNYAVICTIFNLDHEPKVLVVDYKEKSDCEVQQKLPAGRFQAEDLMSAIELFLHEHGRNKSLEFFCMTVDNLNKKYLSDIASAKDLHEQNFYFNNFTEKLLVGLQNCHLSEAEFHEILTQTHLNTVIHELKEETQAKQIGNIYISSISSKDGVHYKIGFVSADVSAPLSYVGSPDRKILKSYWSLADENIVRNLFHGHQVNFQEGIREAIKLDLHPKVKMLETFLTAVI